MNRNWVRILAFSALTATAGLAQQLDTPSASAHARRPGGASIIGIWDVAVTVVNCQTGATLRNVHSVQMYQADGTFSETTSLGTRGSSVGYWYHEEGPKFGANYYFFRYNPDGSFASIAKAVNGITISVDGTQFNVTATIQDYDANNAQISNGCVTQIGKRI